jgi:hypothetical protein
LSQKFPARTAVEFFHNECVDIRVQLKIAFVSHFLEGAVGHRRAVQGVRRPGRSLRVVILSKVFKRLLLQECADSKLQHLDVVGDFPQGVRARVSERDSKVVRKAQEGVDLRIHRRVSAGKILLKVRRKKRMLANKSCGETLLIRDLCKGERTDKIL